MMIKIRANILEIQKRDDSRKDAKTPRTKNSKHEIRNSKQFQMTKICKIPNRLHSDSVFWIFPSGDLFVSEFVSDFDIRI